LESSGYSNPCDQTATRWIIDGSPCSAASTEVGVCCYKDGNNIIQRSSEFILACQCQTLGNNDKLRYKWTPKTDCIKSVDAIDCTDQFNGDGACCDGIGGCTKTLQPNCSKYWQGSGIKCSYNYGSGQQFNVCTTGTGGCCTSTSSSASCVNEVNGLANCNGGSGLFYGCGKICGDGPCTPSSFNLCDGDGTSNDPWKIRRSNGTYQDIVKGQEFAGGIVVGIFNPNGSQCLGNTAFGGYVNPGVELNSCNYFAGSGTSNPNNPFWTGAVGTTRIKAFNFYTGSTLENGAVERPAGIYQSFYDLRGYGFTLNDVVLTTEHDRDQDKWLLIVSKHPVMFRQYANYNGSAAPNQNHFIKLIDGTNSINDNLWIPVNDLGNVNWENSRYADCGIIGGVGLQYAYYNIKNFVWSHGGTSHCDLLGFSDLLTTNITAFSESTTTDCYTNITNTGSVTIHEYQTVSGNQQLKIDGAFGYGGGAATNVQATNSLDVLFRTCSCDITTSCSNCEEYPGLRSRRYLKSGLAGSCGKWSRNHGIYNTIALIKSQIAEHYLYSGSGLFPSNLKSFYGATGEISGLSSLPTSTNTIPGWTGIIQLKVNITNGLDNGGWPALNKTTISEGCSVWNRLYFPVDGPTGNHTGLLNVSLPGYSALNNQYPTLSHWYIPSIDELGFIAKACRDDNLQQTINNAGGIVIGDPRLNSLDWSSAGVGPTGVNSPNSPPANIQYTKSYVWTSTGAWKDGATAQYIQKQSAVASIDPINSGINQTSQFTNAWAIKFDPSTLSQNTSNYKVSKFHDLDDRLELRLVRMVRCDQRYYNSNSDTQLKNTFWQVPRLTISTVVTGLLPRSNVTNIFQLDLNNSSGATYSFSRWTIDPQTATIFKNTP
jgi:hypothetical protein